MKRVVILGTGGHARMVAALLHDMMEHGRALTLAGHTSPDAPTGGDGGNILGDDSLLPVLARAGTATHFTLGIGSVRGGGELRERLFETALRAGLEPLTLRHSSAVVLPDAAVGRGSVLMPGSILCAGASLGDNTILNTRASVDHDSRVGDHSHIAVGATLAGGVTVGRNALVGAGATLSHGVSVGDCATVGAGAVVVRDVESGRVAKGVPAK